MSTDEWRDPLLDALASLSTHAPRASRNARTLARCHAAMKPAPPARPRPSSSARSHVLDRLLPVAIVVYALMAVAAAIRIGWLATG